MFAVAPPPISQPMMLAVVFYNGPEDEARAFYKPLFDLEPLMDTTAMIPYSSLNNIFNAANGHGERKSTKGSTFDPPMRAEFALSIFNRFSDFVTEVPDASGSIIVFEFFNIEKICETSNRAMAFANRDFYGNVMALPKWYDESNDQRCQQWARDMMAVFEEEMVKAKTEGRTAKRMEGVGSYVNYDGGAPSGEPPMHPWCRTRYQKFVVLMNVCSIGSGEKGRSIFGANYERLIELKRKWDPKNAFSKSHVLAPQLDAWHGGASTTATA